MIEYAYCTFSSVIYWFHSEDSPCAILTRRIIALLSDTEIILRRIYTMLMTRSTSEVADDLSTMPRFFLSVGIFFLLRLSQVVAQSPAWGQVRL
jgi:hypothetical protein